MLKKLLHSREVTALGFIVVMFLGVGAVNPGFLTSSNILLLFNSSVVYTVVALGIAVVLGVQTVLLRRRYAGGLLPNPARGAD